METVYYAEFYFPGVFVSETSSRRLGKKEPAPNKVRIPKNAYAFRIRSRLEGKADGERVFGQWKKDKVMYYAPGAQIVAREELGGVARSNCDNNGWDRVVRACNGGIFPDANVAVLL